MSVEPVRHLFTVEDFERMGEAGLFGPEERLELIEGEIIEMAPIGSPHAGIVNRLTQFLVLALAGRAVVTVQNPLRLSDLSQPQPDLVIARARADFYTAAHPRPEDVLWVIEVADTTLRWDRRVKRPLYAATGIAELWIVDVGAQLVDVATGPGAEGFGRVEQVSAGDLITPVALPDFTIAVADLFG